MGKYLFCVPKNYFKILFLFMKKKRVNFMKTLEDGKIFMEKDFFL